MLDHSRRGLAVLSTKRAGRAKSRRGFAQTHPQDGKIARGAKTLATACDDLASVFAARDVAHVAFNEDARCAFPPA